MLLLLSRFAMVCALVGCAGDGGGPGEFEEVDACILAEESGGCDDCTDGLAECSFGDTTARSPSCGTCQAERALWRELCDVDEPASRDELEAGFTCVKATCEVFYDGCADPCTPLCVLSFELPDSTCDLGCYTPTPPPGECVLTFDTCAFQ